MGRERVEQYGVSWAFRLLPQLEESAIYSSRDKTRRVDDPANIRAMRTPVQIYACPSRRAAAADRNFDNNDSPPLATAVAVATLGDYAANAGIDVTTGMGADGFISPAPVDTSVAGPIFSGSEISDRRVTDGLSSTLAVGERHIPPADPTKALNMQEYWQGDTAFLAGDRMFTILRATRFGLANGPNDSSKEPVDNSDHTAEKFGGPHPGVVMFAYLDGHVAPLAIGIEIETLKALSTIAGGEVIAGVSRSIGGRMIAQALDRTPHISGQVLFKKLRFLRFAQANPLFCARCRSSWRPE